VRRAPQLLLTHALPVHPRKYPRLRFPGHPLQPSYTGAACPAQPSILPDSERRPGFRGSSRNCPNSNRDLFRGQRGLCRLQSTSRLPRASSRLTFGTPDRLREGTAGSHRGLVATAARFAGGSAASSAAGNVGASRSQPPAGRGGGRHSRTTSAAGIHTTWRAFLSLHYTWVYTPHSTSLHSRRNQSKHAASTRFLLLLYG
jgi:hypothetical protein